MRVSWWLVPVLALAMGPWNVGAAPAKKAGKKPAATSSSEKSASGKRTTSAATRSKKKAAPRVTWRNRQLIPTPERYREIQTALASKGYMEADRANGQWTAECTEALRKFQSDQKLEASGKINSLSLIALGLGPSYEPSVPAPAPDDQSR